MKGEGLFKKGYECMALFKFKDEPVKGCRTLDEFMQWYLKEHICECRKLDNNMDICSTCGLTVIDWEAATYTPRIEAVLNTKVRIVGSGSSTESARSCKDIDGRPYFGYFCENCGKPAPYLEGFGVFCGLRICGNCYRKGRDVNA